MKEEIVKDFKREFRGVGSRGGKQFGRGDGGDRQMHDATCSNCGRDCKVPFRPSGDKPVFCRECFNEKGGGGDSRRSNDRDYRPTSRPEADYKKQFAAIDRKLDVILDQLTYLKKLANSGEEEA